MKKALFKNENGKYILTINLFVKASELTDEERKGIKQQTVCDAQRVNGKKEEFAAGYDISFWN